VSNSATREVEEQSERPKTRESDTRRLSYASGAAQKMEDGQTKTYERKTSFRLRAFFDLVFVSQLCDANGLPTLHPSWLKNAPMIALGLGSM
jgi:hypothetical protein